MSEEFEVLEANINKELETLSCFNPEDVERGGVSAYLSCTRKELLLLLNLIKGAKEDNTMEWEEDLSTYDKGYPKHIQAINRCSSCGKKQVIQSNFCPNCGAKRRKEVSE